MEAVAAVATADDVLAMVVMAAWVVTLADDGERNNVYALCNVYNVFFVQGPTYS